MSSDLWHALLALAGREREGELSARIAELAPELVQRRPHAEHAEPYGRAVLHRSALGEVMLAGWSLGGRSAPHDHGRASGYVSVLRGTFTETTYRFDGRELEPTVTRELEPGDLVRAPTAEIHDMQSQEIGVTLHLYLPAIEAMRVYDRQGRGTVLVTGACGAWLPRHAALVLERQAWDDAVSTLEI